MTKAQERMVEKIRKEAETFSQWQEIKEFAVEENEYFVSVCVEIGFKDDEGKVAMIFRDRAQIFIGKRGGSRVPCNRLLKSGRYKFFYRKYSNLARAIIDQRL